MGRYVSIKTRIVRFLSLTGEEKRIFCRAFLLCNLYRKRLARQPFHFLLQTAQTEIEKKRVIYQTTLPVNRVAWLIERACQTIFRNSCLPQAFTGYRLFAEYGWQPKLHIGAKKGEQRELRAHAWLSVDGQVTLGSLPNLNEFREFSLREGKEK